MHRCGGLRCTASSLPAAPDIGQMLTLQWVDVEVLRPRVPADDHAAIDRHSRLYEQRPPLPPGSSLPVETDADPKRTSMTATSSEAETLPLFRQVMLLVSLSLGTLIFGMAMTVVNVILPQIQGALSATQDQVAWVVTFHIIAVAIATPLTGWIAGKIGRRRFMTTSIAGFTVSTVLCGASDSLPELVMWRFAQGLLGAPMFPLVQAILLDVFPRRQHAFVITSWGLVAVWGTVIGAVFGGHIGEAIDWRWAFYLIAPIGILAWFGCNFFLSEAWRGRTQHLDWVGFVRGANPGMKRRDSGFEGRFGAPLQGLRGEQWACGRSLASEVREPGNVFGTRDAQAVTEVAPE